MTRTCLQKQAIFMSLSILVLSDFQICVAAKPQTDNSMMPSFPMPEADEILNLAELSELVEQVENLSGGIVEDAVQVAEDLAEMMENSMGGSEEMENLENYENSENAAQSGPEPEPESGASGQNSSSAVLGFTVTVVACSILLN